MFVRVAAAGALFGGVALAGCFDLPADRDSFCQSEVCAVFVSSSLGDDDTADGTRERPFATLSQAVKSAAGAPVYACAETFQEAVAISGTAVVYGGRDCKNDWGQLDGTPTLVEAPVSAVALRIAAEAEVAMYDFALRAADAALDGGSSIAVIAGKDATLELTRCSIEAGAGAPGRSQQVAAPAEVGESGTDGASACATAEDVANGPVGAQNVCGADTSSGGKGGNGYVTKEKTRSGGGGAVGTDVSKNGGAGETDTTPCEAGGDGENGKDGGPGAGATGVGNIGSAFGFAGVAGVDGAPGTPGFGGGGGGGAKGGIGESLCPMTDAEVQLGSGATGGSGGAGGCGGKGGAGGGAGGASIGVVSIGANLVLTTVTIAVKSGGAGGSGAEGQSGGAGGPGGAGGIAEPAGLKAACAGGAGGSGGKGGPGGGGLGGHSIGIAHTGAAPDTGSVIIDVGAAGAGGPGAAGAGDGAAGLSANVQSF